MFRDADIFTWPARCCMLTALMGCSWCSFPSVSWCWGCYYLGNLRTSAHGCLPIHSAFLNLLLFVSMDPWASSREQGAHAQYIFRKLHLWGVVANNCPSPASLTILLYCIPFQRTRPISQTSPNAKVHLQTICRLQDLDDLLPVCLDIGTLYRLTACQFFEGECMLR